MTEALRYIYPLLLVLLGLGFIPCAYGVWHLSPEKLPGWERLPRNKAAGAVLAGAGFCWCIFHANPIFGGNHLQLFSVIAVILTVLSYCLLDYLLARALGGILILLAHYFLYQSFALRAPLLPLFSLCCFALGSVGIFLCGKPHLLREFIRRAATGRRWRCGGTVVITLYSMVFLSYGTIHLIRILR